MPTTLRGVVRFRIAQMLLIACAAFMPRTAVAQGWTSTDVGAVNLAGSATGSGGAWTIQGDGGDIWDRADAFQFLHQPVADGQFVEAHIEDLQNTDPFAKAGVMVRATLDANSAMAILDVRPGGQVEFMARTSAGDAVQFIASRNVTFPVWVRLTFAEGSIRAFLSQDGSNWSFVDNVGITMPAPFEAGVAVTSHDRTQLTTAHVTGLGVSAIDPVGWYSTDVGDVGVVGSAIQVQGEWTVAGAGGDIWGSADAFHFVYRPTTGRRHQFFVRVDNLQNTSPFAKAGLMVRKSLDPGAAMLILDVRPTGDVEFMARQNDGGAVQYLGGVTVTFPVWMKVEWTDVNQPASSPVTVVASVSQNQLGPWVEVGRTTSTVMAFNATSHPISPGVTYQVGIAVTSHDSSRRNVAHFHGLTLSEGPDWRSDDIGATGLVGNAVNDETYRSFPFVVEGSGSDIWGAADSFQFFHLLTGSPISGGFGFERVNLVAAHPFAKAGLMIRDGTAANARMVIVDVKPDGNVEFMARTCEGCPVQYIAGADVGLPAWLNLRYNGTHFTAQAQPADKSRTVDLGSVDVTMPNLAPGFAVTSHDPGQIAIGIFQNLLP
jgi:hypothetical protein